MKERPILFSGPMVKAILEGRKTQTRRVASHPLAKSARVILGPNREGYFDCIQHNETGGGILCPYGAAGDRLWVKETHARVHPGMLQSLDPEPESHEWTTVYRADANGGYVGKLMECTKWKPSIFMRREFSRITLEIENVRVERLQEISEADALKEGVTGDECARFNSPFVADQPTPSMCYANLWNSINGPGSWDANPFVWVIQFRRVQ